jgi:hypothetical protein
VSVWEIALAPLWPYLVLILVGFLPSEVWRALGVVLARGMREDSEILVWVRAVATTLLAGVVVKLLAWPTGALALVPFWGRFGALALGICAFYATRKSVIVGVLIGEMALIGIGYWAVYEQSN